MSMCELPESATESTLSLRNMIVYNISHMQRCRLKRLPTTLILKHVIHLARTLVQWCTNVDDLSTHSYSTSAKCPNGCVRLVFLIVKKNM